MPTSADSTMRSVSTSKKQKTDKSDKNDKSDKRDKMKPEKKEKEEVEKVEKEKVEEEVEEDEVEEDVGESDEDEDVSEDESDDSMSSFIDDSDEEEEERVEYRYCIRTAAAPNKTIKKMEGSTALGYAIDVLISCAKKGAVLSRKRGHCAAQYQDASNTVKIIKFLSEDEGITNAIFVGVTRGGEVEDEAEMFAAAFCS